MQLKRPEGRAGDKLTASPTNEASYDLETHRRWPEAKVSKARTWVCSLSNLAAGAENYRRRRSTNRPRCSKRVVGVKNDLSWLIRKPKVSKSETMY